MATETTTIPVKPVANASHGSKWLNENHDVRALVNYFPDENRVYDDKSWPSPAKFGEWHTSSRFMTFHNARGNEDAFSLEKNGFEFFTLPVKERDVSDDEKIREEYLPEVAEVVKKLTGASHVFPLHHVLRCALNERYADQEDKDRPGYIASSTVWPHSDGPMSHPDRLPGSFEASERRACDLRPDLAGEIARASARARRRAMVQTWRPLRAVERLPLALCDGASYDPSEWRLRGNPRVSYSVLSHPGREDRHRWYYLHAMAPTEMYVFMGFDSRFGEPGYTGYTGAHTAFALPDEEGKPPRENVEARFLCYWD